MNIISTIVFKLIELASIIIGYMIVFIIFQEVLLWIKSVVEDCGENVSTEQLRDYVWKTLNSGKVS